MQVRPASCSQRGDFGKAASVSLTELPSPLLEARFDCLIFRDLPPAISTARRRTNALSAKALADVV